MMLRGLLSSPLAHEIQRRGLSIGAELRDKVLEKMFNEAYQKYKDKSIGGGFFEPSKKILKELEDANKALLQKYKATDEAGISEFPKFDFGDPEVDPLLDEPECDGCAVCEEPEEPQCEKEQESKE